MHAGAQPRWVSGCADLAAALCMIPRSSLDEPTIGLDGPGERIRQFIQSINRKRSDVILPRTIWAMWKSCASE
jgi:ABC-type uncharacterized transport system ATPase subunit